MRKCLLIAALLMVPPLAGAYNFSFLGDSIFSDLSEEDTLAIKASVRQALDSAPDESRTVWTNEKGDIKVAITPKLSYQIDGQQCRRTELRMTGERRANERFVFELCKTPEGWAFSPSPINSFTDKDAEIFDAQLQDILETGANGAPVTWINPETGNSAVIVPLKNVPVSGKRCREAAISVMDYKNRSADGRYTFCRGEDGRWTRSSG